MLDITQIFAWTRMFAGYARTESIAAAAKETFDPGKPCAICQAVSKARKSSNQRGPAVRPDSEKIVFILHTPAPFLTPSAQRSWSEILQPHALVRIGEVPVPPPKAISA